MTARATNIFTMRPPPTYIRYMHDEMEIHRMFMTCLTRQCHLIRMIPFIMQHYTNKFILFQAYLENYDAAIKHVQHIRTQSPELDFFLSLQEEAEGDKLPSFLILPIQRLPRYILLLQELKKNTKADDPTLPDLKDALTSLRLIANEINSSLRSKSAVDIVRQIEDMFEKDDRFQPLVTPARCLVKQGALRKKFSEKSRNLLGAKEYQFFVQRYPRVRVLVQILESWVSAPRCARHGEVQS